LALGFLASWPSVLRGEVLTSREGAAEVQRVEDEAIIERLTEGRDIGRWTVEMLLMFRLGRPDVLPADDDGIGENFAIAFKKRELPARSRADRGAFVRAQVLSGLLVSGNSTFSA
jgi:hypothetical protein